MISRGIRAIVALSMASALVSCAPQAPDSFAPGPAPGAVTEAPAASAPVPPDPDPWPRQLQLSNAMLTVYQPQVEAGRGTSSPSAPRLPPRRRARTLRPSVSSGARRARRWTAWRAVTIEDLRLTRSNFPTLPDNGAAYLSELQQPFQGAARTIVARPPRGVAGGVRHRTARRCVQNDPPQIFVSNSPALLVSTAGPCCGQSPTRSLSASSTPTCSSCAGAAPITCMSMTAGCPPARWRALEPDHGLSARP